MKFTYLVLSLFFTTAVFAVERPVVKAVKFQGNKSYSDSRLKSLMGTRPGGIFKKRRLYQDIFIWDLKNISDYYYRHGFLDAKIEDVKLEWVDDSSKVNISVIIDEGEPVILDTVIISGLERIKPETILGIMKVKKGQRIDFEKLSYCEDNITQYLGNLGFLSASIYRSFSREGNTATLIFNIEEGPQYIFGDVIITGNRKTKKWVIRDKLKIDTGDTLTLKQVEAFRKALYKQGLFEVINIESEETPFKHIRDLKVHVVEKEAGEFSLGGGYGSEEQFRVGGQIGYINLFGRAAGISGKMLVCTRERRIEGKFFEPRFFKSNFFFDTEAAWRFREENDFNREIRESILRFGRILGQYVRWSMGYNYRRTILTEIIPDLQGELKGFRSSQIFTETTFDSRDNKIFTRKGLYFNGRIGAAEPFLLGDLGFLKLKGDLRAYYSLKKSVVIASQYQSEILFKLEDKELPLEELFFLGGSKTIRGYDYYSLGPQTLSGKPSGGKYYYFVRNEVLLNVWKPLWLEIFLDNGGLYKHFIAARFDESYTGGGLGMQLLVGVWTARLEYAWQFELDEMKPGRFYFNIGSTF